MIFDLINIQRNPCCIFEPSLVAVKLEIFKRPKNKTNKQKNKNKKKKKPKTKPNTKQNKNKKKHNLNSNHYNNLHKN